MNSQPATEQGIGFVLASCAYPAGVLDGSPSDTQRTVNPGPAHKAFRAMAACFDADVDGAWGFSVLTGDQVYADATAGLFDPGLLDDALRTAYDKRFKLNQAWAEVTAAAPGPFCHFTLFDDHEIRNNWAEGTVAGEGGTPDPQLPKAVEAYIDNSRAICWPRQIEPPATDPETGRKRLWQDTVPHGYPLFLADTRTERERRTPATLGTASLMGGDQQRDLHAWIARHAGTAEQPPRFVVSPSIVLPRRLSVALEPARAVYEDAWPGYPMSLHLLLACLCDHEARNIVLLSGDEHLPCLARIDIARDDGRRARVYSVHSPALYAPFPFVNATRHEFAGRESFGFQAPASPSDPQPWSGHDARHGYTCQVRSVFPDMGDGFATVRTHKEDAAWHLKVAFHPAEEGGASVRREFQLRMGDASVDAAFDSP